MPCLCWLRCIALPGIMAPITRRWLRRWCWCWGQMGLRKQIGVAGQGRVARPQTAAFFDLEDAGVVSKVL